MARCVLCDRSNDVDAPYLSIRYDKEVAGYVCEECSYEVYTSLEEMEERDREDEEVVGGSEEASSS